MSKIDTLNAILLDPTSIEVPALTPQEVYELAIGLSDRLAALQIEHEIDNDAYTTKEWDQITDNLITFIMEHESFHTEQIVFIMVRVWRHYNIPFCSETEAFGKMFDEISPWLM